MSKIDPITSSPFPLPPAGAGPAARRPADASFASAMEQAQTAPVAPDEPSAAALAAVEVAGRVYEELRATDRQLHFEQTTHGVRIDVYDGDGQLVQRVPATDLLKLAAGEKTWLA